MKVTIMDQKKRFMTLKSCGVRWIYLIIVSFEESTFSLNRWIIQSFIHDCSQNAFSIIRSANILKGAAHASAHFRSIVIGNMYEPVALYLSYRPFWLAFAFGATRRCFGWCYYKYFCSRGIHVHFAASFAATRLAFAVGSKTPNREMLHSAAASS